MENLLHDAPVALPEPPGLLLHCGAHRAGYVDVCSVRAPRPTRTWNPLPHQTLVETVRGALRQHGLRVTGEAHALSHEGARYFGLLGIGTDNPQRDYSFVVGLRNSHDRSLPAGLVAGVKVLACDNLAFSGEVKLQRKHTRHILRDLPQLVADGIGRLQQSWVRQDVRIGRYRAFPLTDPLAHDLAVRAVDQRVFPNRLMPAVLHEWREPRHDEFRPRSIWSWCNAVTECLKGGDLNRLPARSAALHRLCDQRVGLN